MTRKLTRRSFLRAAAFTTTGALLAACAPNSAGNPSSAPGAAAPAATAAAPASGATAAPAAGATAVSGGAQSAVAHTGKLSTDLDHPVTFSYLRPVWGPATHQKGAAYEQILFKTANVQIQSQIVPVFDYETKFPVMVAGGAMSDIMWNGGPSWGPAHDMIQQGAFLPLDDLLAEYPDVKAAVSDSLWDTLKSEDGKHYFFPQPLSPWVPFPVYYRADTFKELGIKEPTSIDELVAALKTIKQKKPDMVPLTAHEYSTWYFKELATAFGYGSGNWVPDPADPNPDNPAKIVPSTTITPYKDFLAWLQMLRKEGLIDPDYLIAQGKKGLDKFNAGQAATMVGHWAGLVDWLPELRKSVASADVAYMPLLKGPARSMGGLTLSGYDRGWSMSVKAKDKAEDIFSFLNWVYTVGYDFMRYGVEGEMYKVDQDGNKVSIADTERKAGFKLENVEPFSFPLKSADSIPNLGQSWFDVYTLYKARGIEDKVPMVRSMFENMANNPYPNYNRNTFSPTAGKKGDQLYQQYIKPMEEKIAIDPTTPLSTWDTNIKAWLDNGGNDIIKETNEIQKDKSKPVVKYEYKGKDYK